MKVTRVKEMQGLDSTATSRFKIGQDILMENAGMAALQALQLELGEHEVCRCSHFGAVDANGRVQGSGSADHLEPRARGNVGAVSS